jgi:beta-barrel assembly-enhancing protease
MRRLKRIIAILTGLCVLIMTLILPMHVRSQTIAHDPVILMAQQASPGTNPIYEEAKANLPESYYILYRVAERIARANALDNTPWRMVIPSDYNVNAFATDTNLVAVYAGLLDVLYGDPNALAFVVGHEMGHHIRNHIPVAQAEQQQILQRLRSEAVEEVTAEEEDVRADLQRIEIGQWIAGGTGTLAASMIRGQTGGIGGFLGRIVSDVLQRESQRRVQRALERIDQIYAQKQAQQEKEWTELNHRHEFEADESGYLYMAQAGFDPDGCLTALNILNRQLGSQMSSGTHPAIPERTAKLNELLAKYPPASLVAQGKSVLASNPQPLTYDRSLDDQSLRVNSRTGSSGNIDQRLPQ